MSWPRPFVTVDVVVLTVLDGALQVLLIERGADPFAGHWALPGGFVEVEGGPTGQGEDLDDAARRELAEETGLSGDDVVIAQLGAFGRPGRDTRGRVITVAYYALVPPDLAADVRAGSDAAKAGWRPVHDLAPGELAFDHDEILAAALAAVGRALDDTPIAFTLVPATFTVAELRGVYEQIGGERLDPANFNRRFKRLVERGLVEACPSTRATSARPAREYRFLRPDAAGPPPDPLAGAQ
jgi:8-oxo-dGTP diphosphatase